MVFEAIFAATITVTGYDAALIDGSVHPPDRTSQTEKSWLPGIGECQTPARVPSPGDRRQPFQIFSRAWNCFRSHRFLLIATRSETMANMRSSMARDVATDETGSLIAASKVNGTSVYNRQGESLGSIYDVMIDKISGQVSYAVMSFGGFLGMGEDYHPLPWSVLHYDTNQGGYVVDLNKERLEGAPTYREDDIEVWDDPEYTRGIDEFYAR